MNTKPRMLKRALYFIVPLVLIAVLVVKLKNNKKVAQDKVYQYDKEQPINVQADTLQIEDLSSEINYSGTFEPNKETKLSAEIQGKINEIFVDVGSYVNKGQTVVQLDNSLLKLQVKNNEVQIEGLEADVNRYTILANADAIQGVQLEKAVLGLKSAKTQKAILLEQIDKTTIKAPFNGIVTAKLSEVGAFAASGIPLLQISDITNLKFTVNVPESELSHFKFNQSYSITTDAYSESLVSGKAIMIGSKANLGNSFPVQFAVNNTSDLKIKSGMFGKVILKNETGERGLIIPSSAIIGTASQPQVYLIKNGKSVLQNISISTRVKNKAIVSNGLKEGDVIVTIGFINLFDGANVTFK